MDIASLGICRANQKVYEKLEINDLKGNKARIVYYDSEKGNLPCQLFRLTKNQYVAVTPDLQNSSASYFVAAINDQDRVTDLVEHVLDFDSAKWQSRINYRLHKELCSEIRCYDESHSLNDGSRDYLLTDIISCPDHLQFRMMFTFPGTEFKRNRKVRARTGDTRSPYR